MRTIILAIAITLFSACGGESKPNLESIAFTQAKAYLKTIVSDPGSFDGGHMADSVVPMDDSTFIVNSTFTAKNQFGGTVKTKYNITLHYKGGDAYETGSWEVTELLLDDKKVK